MSAAGHPEPADLPPEGQRDAVVLAALADVPFDGWGPRTLKASADRVGLGADAALRLFPAGARDAVAHFSALADRLMVEDLKTHDLAALRLRERVALAIRLRLERWTPHREAVRRAALLTPLFALTSARGLYDTVDAVWRGIGDRATDFNFYTKRGLLAGVYGTTLLHWFDDRSPGCAATWAFLDRRIADVMKIPKLRGQITERLKNLPDPRRVLRRVAPGFTRRNGI